ncbi:disintegrin and metalloproteinase domain-containing protein 33 isoform X4 [Alexandromys fortis]|uniref:disintegrin and metalloproteinase domain-containing protein 33 isoform X4 n=1 Tax=Alexandromys fortis TaxID=100897 RepID=UPI002153215B|nr:disintegrin and metalloproteinase domain-containing protein 33 isoform X4 [Microtus fortis]
MGPECGRSGGSPVLLLLQLLLSACPLRSALMFPENVPGEPVTPHWILDGGLWLKVTLEEPAPGPRIHRNPLQPRWAARGPVPQPHGSLPLPWACEGLPGILGSSQHLLWDEWPDCSQPQYQLLSAPLGFWGQQGLLNPQDLPNGAIVHLERELQIQSRNGQASSCPPEQGEARGPQEPQFLVQHQNLNHTRQRLLEVANCVDQILRSLDIQVVLTGLEVWTEQDRSRITQDANATLWAFLQWRRGLWSRRPHDSTQLLTGRTFQGTTVGLAPVEGMCSAESSGGVSTDHSELPIGTAATMAHEIGHSLGLRHDPDGCCMEADAEQGGCVMEAATGHPFPRVFSACSRRQLRIFFRKGGGACLSNTPGPGLLVLPTRCGNGFVEAGEECDCGSDQKCSDSCCVAHNCSLRAGAQCAHGDCCAQCLLKPAGTPCRPAASDCDLPEFCTGASPHCPADIYLLDGSPCAKGRGYCLDGWCPTLERQCQQLWGPGSQPAPEFCFQEMNSMGNSQGNCGRDSKGSFLPCAQRDAQCGKLLCHGGEQTPFVLQHVVTMNPTILLGGHGVACQGVFILPDTQLDQLDLGLVEPGTRCGPKMVCQDRHCQNVTSQELDRCLTACNNHGVCNSNRHCHCAPGWDPPFCDKPGFGGSLDSGPAQPANRDAFPLPMLLSFLLPLLPGAGLAWCYYRLPTLCQRPWWCCRRDPVCNRTIEGPCRDHPLGNVHSTEFGFSTTGESSPLEPENSVLT